MTLDAYLASTGQTLTDMAAKLKLSKGRLSQLRAATNWPPELAMRVEAVTEGAIDASDLSPVVADARRTSPEQAAA